jgi:hypothetical protein
MYPVMYALEAVQKIKEVCRIVVAAGAADRYVK